jgi:hypothetical protein
MKQLSLVLLILFIQESVTLNGLLVKTHQGDYSALTVTTLFIIITVIDIMLGFLLGKYAKQKWNNGKVELFAKKMSDRFYAYIGKRGRKIYLLLLGYFSFPYVNAFIAAWLNISFAESFWYIFAGNMIFYATSWLLVLGITSIVPNPFFAFIAVIAVTILLVAATRVLKSQKI